MTCNAREGKKQTKKASYRSRPKTQTKQNNRQLDTGE